MKNADGLQLLEDLSGRRLTFAEFLAKFRELPKAEQDRLLATKPESITTKTTHA
jgi:hypothetical protein